MDPYAVLGIARNSSEEDARAAYRKLAMKYHPDRGGNEAKFKEIKEAWEQIEGGETIDVGPIPKSSFNGGQPEQSAANHFKAEPAPGYEARGKAPDIPVAIRSKWGGNSWWGKSASEYSVTLTISEQQGFEGCVVPFLCNGLMLEHIVPTGTIESSYKKIYFPSGMIGGGLYGVDVNVNLIVTKIGTTPRPKSEKKYEPPSDVEMTLHVCALALFTGAHGTSKDPNGNSFTFSIPPGFNPAKPLILKGRGLGSSTRGDLILNIKALFKIPKDLNSKDLELLDRLNELVK
jgi:curved DNA-binding protein